MPKICVQSPEIAMHGDINLHAQVAVVTTAKLDSLTVGGSCDCADVPTPVPTPKPLLEIVLMVDGSDSYNNKVGDREGVAFVKTMEKVGDLIRGIEDSAVVSIVQFSGVKKLEKDYVPGSGGKVKGLDMYTIECQPTLLKNNAPSIISKFRNIETLDGNGQLFLALQDMSMDSFLNKMDSVKRLEGKQDRERVLIFWTDEEWDINNLANGFGRGYTDKFEVAKRVHEAYSAVYPCILRRDRLTPMNVDFIRNNLANGQSNNVQDIHTDNFESEASRAVKKILSSLRR